MGDGKLVLNSTAVTSTNCRIKCLDGITSTVSELNIVDGDTSASSSTIVDVRPLIILNDSGTMETGWLSQHLIHIQVQVLQICISVVVLLLI